MNKQISQVFEKQGYVILDGKDYYSSKIRDIIVKVIKSKIPKNKYSKFKTDDLLLNNFHKIVRKNEINDLRFLSITK